MELDTKNLFDFKYLINCTLDGKITWKTLTFFLNDLTPTLPKAKELLKIMLKEFEAFHKKSKGIQMIKDNDDIGEESEPNTDGNDLELDEDEYKFETLQEKKKDMEIESSEEIELENNLVNDEIVENAEMYEITRLENQDYANDTDHKNDMTNKDIEDESSVEILQEKYLFNEEGQADEMKEMDEMAEDLENKGVPNDTDHKNDMSNKENEASKGPFKCLNCDKEYNLKHSFRRHCRKVHPEDYLKSKKKVNMPFKCKGCERQFQTKIYLRKHYKRVHLGTKSVCDVCGESFYNLKKHMLIHTRETPYECKAEHESLTKIFSALKLTLSLKKLVYYH